MFGDLRYTFELLGRHPLTHGHRLSAIRRIARWQTASRLSGGSAMVPWVNGTRLVVERGMVGATGNIYFGLHEFEEMGFLLHFLRPNDLFIDIGANVGTYTVLAAGAVGASVVSFEPVPTTFERLLDNIHLNRLSEMVDARNCGLGAEAAVLKFSADLDTMNHVLSPDTPGGVEVPVESLDSVLAGRTPALIKMDVEGFETEVVNGGARTFDSPGLQAVLIELSGGGARFGFDEEDIRRRFADWGFTPCNYDPLTREIRKISDEKAATRNNTLFIRNADGVRSRVMDAPPFRILGREI